MTATAQERPRGATLCPRSGAAAKRNYPTSEVNGGWEELPCLRPQGQRQNGDTPRLRSGATAKRSYPTSKVRGGREETPCIRGQGGGQEELPRIRGQCGREETPRVRGQGGGWEEPPTPEALAPPPGGATRGAVAAQEQEGLEELSHVEGQELWQ